MKLAHISLDDCVYWADLTDRPADTLFAHPLLADLRALHERYGATFTLNLFVTDGTRRLRELDDRHAAEYAANADWLRLSFHAEDTDTHYDRDCPGAIVASYREFTDAALRMTGTARCLDRVVRLGFFSGSLANVQAIRALPFGPTALLTADDTRRAYYFDEALNRQVYEAGQALDEANGLPLIRSEKRLESRQPIAEIAAVIGLGRPVLEFFTHEQNWTPQVRERTAQVCRMLLEAGYAFGFVQDVL